MRRPAISGFFSLVDVTANFAFAAVAPASTGRHELRRSRDYAPTEQARSRTSGSPPLESETQAA